MHCNKHFFSWVGRMACLVFAVALLPGCVHYGPVIMPGDRFTGLRRLASGGTLIRVFMIHGMRHQDRDYADGFSRQVAAALGWTESGVSGDDHVVDGGGKSSPTGDRAFSQANIRVRRFVDSTGQVRMVFYAYAWSTLTDTPKTLALGADDLVARAAANGMLKTSLMNDGLSDAVLYVEHFDHDLLHRTALAALGAFSEAAYDGPVASGRSARTVFISESLGSVILYDAIDARFRTWVQQNTSLTIPADLAAVPPGYPRAGATPPPTFSPHDAACFADAIAGVAYVYMFANQIQFLDVLANSGDPTDRSQRPLNRMERFARERAAIAAGRPRRSSRVDIVDFSDPNDLLTYRLDASQVPSDVFVHPVAPHNDCDWFGLFERPDIAHTGYRKTALRYVVDGAP